MNFYEMLKGWCCGMIHEHKCENLNATASYVVFNPKWGTGVHRLLLARD